MAKILVTDDAAFMRMVIKTAVTKQGHEVIEANNGKEMLDRYRETQPDIVTLDITMPEMDGLEAIKELKKFAPSAKVIMCTAMGQQSMVLEALTAGASDFIVKPFTEDRIIEAVAKVLSK